VTNTIEVTSAFTVTSTFEAPTTEATVFVPITLGTSVPVTEVLTVPSEETETAIGGTVYVTSSFSVLSTVTAPPATSTLPPTTSTKPPASHTSAPPLQVSTSGAQATNKPVAFAMAGAMAFLVLV